MQFFVEFLFFQHWQLVPSKRFHNDLLKNDEKFLFSKEPMDVTDNWLVDTVLKFDRKEMAGIDK